MIYDFVIIGGGILGLATARELLRRQPRSKLLLLEKEADFARHQSGHNSGVIHSGVYYQPGSLKSRLCREGREAIWAYCKQRSIPFKTLGKLIVATNQDELVRLEALYQRGLENGVPGLIMLDGSDIREYEPYCQGLRAVYSPATGIVDFKQVCQSLAQDAKRAGGELFCGQQVLALERHRDVTVIRTQDSEYQGSIVVACAGLHADRVAAMTGNSPDPKIIPFRGEYLLLKSEKSYLVKGNIYPVPDPRLPFLGVHLTPRLDGQVLLGPNALVAWTREGYTSGDFDFRDFVETFTYPGFVRLALRLWQAGAAEIYRTWQRRLFVQSLQKYIPDIKEADCISGPSGVRAQALSKEGKFIDDFHIDQQEGIIHVRNAPSPAATSSLAIARHLADLVAQNATLTSR